MSQFLCLHSRTNHVIPVFCKDMHTHGNVTWGQALEQHTCTITELPASMSHCEHQSTQREQWQPVCVRVSVKRARTGTGWRATDGATPHCATVRQPFVFFVWMHTCTSVPHCTFYDCTACLPLILVKEKQLRCTHNVSTAIKQSIRKESLCSYVVGKASCVGAYFSLFHSWLPERRTPAAHSGQTPVHNTLEPDLAFSRDSDSGLKKAPALTLYLARDTNRIVRWKQWLHLCNAKRRSSSAHTPKEGIRFASSASLGREPEEAKAKSCCNAWCQSGPHRLRRGSCQNSCS